MNFSTQPENQLLERHLEQFTDKNLLIVGYCEESAPFYFGAQSVHLQTTQFQLYEQFKATLPTDSVNQTSFGLFPSEEVLKQTEVVIYYWSKSKQQSLFQLQFLMAHLPTETDFFVVGENRSGINSLKELVKPNASVNKLDSARRCSLYYVNVTQKPAFNLTDWWHSFVISDSALLPKGIQSTSIEALPGVFSQKSLDVGTALLLKTVLKLEEKTLQKNISVLDLGCGSGVIAKTMLLQNPNLNLIASDIDALSIESAKRNLAEFKHAQVQASHVFSTISDSFDLILSNPPFHQGQKTDYSAVESLILEAKLHLKPNGKFYLVANHFLPYEELMQTQFKTVVKCAETTQFKVYQLS